MTATRTVTYFALTHMEPGQTIGPFTHYGWDHAGTACMVRSSGSSWQGTDKPWIYEPQLYLSCACGIQSAGAGPTADYGRTTPADWDDAARACVEAFLTAHASPR